MYAYAFNELRRQYKEKERKEKVEGTVNKLNETIEKVDVWRKKTDRL